MISEIRKEMAGLIITRKTLRNFGLLFFIVFGIWAGLIFWKGNPDWKWASAISMGFFLTGIFSPTALRQPYRLWMSLAFVLGWFMTRAILVAAFSFIMTPMGWLLKIMGKDLLAIDIRKETETYWKKHEPAGGREQYKKQF